jgi:undecaprenyl-diphosphatase
MNLHKRSWSLLIGGTIISLAMGLALAAYYSNYFWFDPWIAQGIQRINLPGFRALMIAVSEPGYRYHWPIVWGVALAAFLMRRKREAFFLLTSAFGAWIMYTLLKLLIARPRPGNNLITIYSQHNTMSFPSGHVVSYVAFYGLLFYMIYATGDRSPFRIVLLIFLGLLIGMVGASRVYLGAHWPSDVVGGYLFGSIWLLLMIRLYEKRSRVDQAESSTD